VPSDTWWNLPDPKRQRVLEAAMAEFGRRGFSSGSLNVIARDAEVAKGSLFQYFEDKLDLFTFVSAEVSDRIRDTVLDGLDADRQFFAVLLDLTDRWIDFFGSHHLERAFAFAAAHEMDADAGSAVRSVTNARFVEALLPMVKRAADQGELASGTNPDDVIALVILLLRHLDSAPWVAHLDPILGLYGLDDDGVHHAGRRLVTALTRAFGATT
jgi:AcrR family transcriptional regulator